MVTKKHVKKPKPLKAGRPPTVKTPPAKMSSQTTRKIIRGHHTLNKKIALAEAAGNSDEVASLQKQLSAQGGLQAYQLASIQGQALDRGGDSSEQLMAWLKPTAGDALAHSDPKLRMLEVGALSTKNACARSGLFDLTRIDLNSQSDGITKQDFMERPPPTSSEERFAIISLSLVLNYVSSAAARGEMLRRTTKFLHSQSSSSQIGSVFPALFLVLPAPCVANSRYFNEERLTLIMASLGYVLIHFKQTAKLVYYLWQLRDPPVPVEQNFRKAAVVGREKGPRNNFAVELMPT